MSKGRIAEFKFLKRVNLGNYEHEEAQVTYVPSEDESSESVVKESRKVVELSLGLKPETVKETKKEVLVEEKAKKVLNNNVTTSAVAKSAVKSATKEIAKELSVEEETEVEVESEIPDISEAIEAQAEVVEEKKEEKPKKRVTTKSKAVVYNREDASHKKLLAEFLNESAPNWKQEKLSKVQSACVTLAAEKVDFLGDEGISELFKQRLLELIK